MAFPPVPERTPLYPEGDAERRREEQKYLRDIAGSVVSAGAFAGAAYFGVQKLRKRYGDKVFTLEHLENATTEFLMKRGIVSRRRMPTDTNFHPGDMSKVGPNALLSGARLSVPGGIFGVDLEHSTLAEFQRRKDLIQKAVTNVLANVVNRLRDKLDDGETGGFAGASEHALVRTLEYYRNRPYDPMYARLKDIIPEAEKLISSHAPTRVFEMLRLFEAITPLLKDSNPGVFEAQFASKLLEFHGQIIGSFAPATTAMGLPIVGAKPPRVVELTTSLGNSTIVNSTHSEVIHSMWSANARGGFGMKQDRELTGLLRTAMRPYGVQGISITPAMALAPNRKAIRRIINTLMNTDGVHSVDLVGIETTNERLGHQVARIRYFAHSYSDPSRLVSDEIRVPLEDKFGQFTTEYGANVRAGVVYVPEFVRTKKGNIVPGISSKQYYLRGVEHFAMEFGKHADKVVREAREPETAVPVHPGQRLIDDMYNKAFLEDSVLPQGDGIYSRTFGTRLQIGVVKEALDQKNIQERLHAHQQYQHLRGARDTGRPVVVIDIETVDRNFRGHPSDRVFSAEIYQVSVTKYDPTKPGTIMESKLWWVNTHVPFAGPWLEQISEGMTDTQRRQFQDFLRANVRNGLDITTVIKEMTEMIRPKGNEKQPVIVGQFSERSDLPTLLRISDEISRTSPNIGRAFREALLGGMQHTDPSAAADTWLMARAGMRIMDQSLELSAIAKALAIEDSEILTRVGMLLKKTAFRGGDHSEIKADPRKLDRYYARQHQSIYDNAMTQLIIEHGFLNPRNELGRFMAKNLGSTKLTDHLQVLTQMGLDPTIVLEAINVAKQYEYFDVDVPEDWLKDNYVAGHPSTMAMGMGNLVDPQNFSPLGYGDTLTRGFHKRLNTAQFMHDTIGVLTGTSFTGGDVAPGSSLWPWLVTGNQMEYLQDRNQRGTYLAQFFMARTAFVNTPYATEGQSLIQATPEELKGIRVAYPKDNYWIDLGSTVRDTSNVKLLGKSKHYIAGLDALHREVADRLEHSVADTERFVVHPNEWIVLEIETSQGTEFVQKQYTGPFMAQIRAGQLNNMKNAIHIHREIIMTAENVNKWSIADANVTGSQIENDTFVAVGSGTVMGDVRTASSRIKSTPESRIFSIMGWSEGVTKHMEHGRKAKILFGKTFDPLIQFLRKNPGNHEAKELLGWMIRHVFGDEAERVDIPVHHGVNTGGPSQLVAVKLNTLDAKRTEELLEKGLNWNVIADSYTAINEFEKRYGGLLPWHLKYEDAFELEDAQRELDTWKKHLEDQMVEIRTKRAIEQDAAALDELARKYDLLDRDRQGLSKLRGQLLHGGLKFHEHVMEQVERSPHQVDFIRHIALVAGVPHGLSLKDVHDAFFAARIGDDDVLNFDGLPGKGIKLRAQVIQNMYDGMRSSGLSQDQSNVVTQFFYDHLAREQIPAVQVALGSVDFVLNNQDPEAIRRAGVFVERLAWVDVKKQVKDVLGKMENLQGMLTDKSISEWTYVTQAHGQPVRMDKDGMSSSTDAILLQGATEAEALKVFEDMGYKGGKVVRTRLGGPDLARMVSSKDIEGTFLDLPHLAYISVEDLPPQVRPFIQFNEMEARKVLTSRHMPASRIEEIISRYREQWKQPATDLKIPALSIFGKGRMAEGGLMALGEQQLTLLNLLSSIVDIDDNASPMQTYYHVQQHFMNYVTRVGNELGGRKDMLGTAITAHMPSGFRALSQLKSSMFAGHPEFFDPNHPLFEKASKYNALFTSVITEDGAAFLKLREQLAANHVPADKIDAIMTGADPIPNWVQREPSLTSTSVTPIHTYVIPNEIAPERMRQMAIDYRAQGKMIIFTDRVTQILLKGDFDGESNTFIFPLGKNSRPEDFNAISTVMNQQIRHSKEMFMNNHWYALAEFTAAAGTDSTGKTKWLQYQWNEGKTDVVYAPVTDTRINNALDELSRTDPKMAEMFSAGWRDNMVGRAEADRLAAALLAHTTGPLTAAVWKVRTAFEYALAGGNIDDEIRKRATQAFRGEQFPFPALLYERDGTWYPVQDAVDVINNKTMIDVSLRDIPTIQGELVEGLSITKRKKAPTAAKHIRDVIGAVQTKQAPEVIEQLLVGVLSDKGLGFFANPTNPAGMEQLNQAQQANIISRFMTIIRELDSEQSHEFHTLMNNIISTRPTTHMDTLDLLEQIKKAHRIPTAFGEMQAVKMLTGNAQFQDTMTVANAMASEELKGLGKPKYFHEGTYTESIAKELGMNPEVFARRGRTAGGIALALAGISMLMPDHTDWFLGGPSQGRGGEVYDFFGDGPELPRGVPLNVPEYTWDREYTSLGPFDRGAQMGVKMDQYARLAVNKLEREWQRPRESVLSITYNNKKRNQFAESLARKSSPFSDVI